MVNDMGNGRYIKVPKRELTRTCVSSIVNSINQVKGHDIKLYVLDDHSDADSLTDINNIINKCCFPSKLISVNDGTGNGHTMKRVYDIVDNEVTDLWYHVEDDYLHYPEAIQDMIDSVIQFEENTGAMIAINPHDDIWRYTNEIYESILLLGPYRHYRTVKHTTYTCLASKQIFNKYKNHFLDVVNLTLAKAPWVENKSINLVWNNPDVMLFSPIPGLGFHIMDESGRDPYIDIVSLWDSVPRLWEDNQKFAVVSMYNDKHRTLGEVTWKNKKEYADNHGYLAICKTENWTLTPIHFEKIKLMLEVLNEHPEVEWAWWLDNDAVITNQNTTLDSIVDENYHVIITCDIASINAGSFLVRNSLQGRQWLEFILKKGLEHYKDNRWPEQQPMTDFYITFKDIVKVVPQRTMNSYDYRIYQVDPTDQLGFSGQWEQNDFVLHLPGLDNQIRLKIIDHYTK